MTDRPAAITEREHHELTALIADQALELRRERADRAGDEASLRESIANLQAEIDRRGNALDQAYHERQQLETLIEHQAKTIAAASRNERDAINTIARIRLRINELRDASDKGKAGALSTIADEIDRWAETGESAAAS